MIRKLLASLKQGTQSLNYGRAAVVESAVRYVKKNKPDVIRILDMGLGGADDLINIRKSIEAISKAKIILYGVEVYPPYIEAAEGLGIEIIQIDVERGTLPFEDQYFDIIVANQIVEHTKEVFWIFSEISRVVKPSGIAIIGVPNLASFHNRIALLFGLQPTCIEPLSAHVRGFTLDGFKRLIECDGYFKLICRRGSNFYPLPPAISRPITWLLPAMAVCSIFTIQRTVKPGLFIDVLNKRRFETPYYAGAGTNDPRCSSSTASN